MDLSQMKIYPCVVPDRGVSSQTMDQAVAKLHAMVQRQSKPEKKRWWKFW